MPSKTSKRPQKSRSCLVSLSPSLAVRGHRSALLLAFVGERASCPVFIVAKARKLQSDSSRHDNDEKALGNLILFFLPCLSLWSYPSLEGLVAILVITFKWILPQFSLSNLFILSKQIKRITRLIIKIWKPSPTIEDRCRSVAYLQGLLPLPTLLCWMEVSSRRRCALTSKSAEWDGPPSLLSVRPTKGHSGNGVWLCRSSFRSAVLWGLTNGPLTVSRHRP